jgi:protein phosphatase
MGSNFRVESFGLSDIGNTRSNNEDNYLIDDIHGLYGVADGMGGHVGGERASGLAMASIIELTHRDRKVLKREQESVEEMRRFFSDSFQLANRRILEEAKAKSQYAGMGTTLTACGLVDSQAVFAHVGDSRAYIASQKSIRQVTDDHSFINEQIKKGRIDKSDARAHLLKNVITRSCGVYKTLEVDFFMEPLQSGDILLLCTDGLVNYLSEMEILEQVRAKQPEWILPALIHRALQKGGDDNITAVLIHLLP